MTSTWKVFATRKPQRAKHILIALRSSLLFVRENRKASAAVYQCLAASRLFVCYEYTFELLDSWIIFHTPSDIYKASICIYNIYTCVLPGLLTRLNQHFVSFLLRHISVPVFVPETTNSPSETLALLQDARQLSPNPIGPRQFNPWLSEEKKRTPLGKK